MVDIESNLSSNRGPLIARVHEIATSLPSPTIVLGDFNTPHTSVFFREFRQSFQHAFESSGSGLIPTWPALCPALALDHIWLSADVTPVRTRTLRTFRSDHALVIADVTLNPVAPRSSPRRARYAAGLTLQEPGFPVALATICLYTVGMGHQARRTI